MTRESVSDLLWTDRGAEQARHSLRQTLLVLRREMPDVIGGDPRTLSFRPDSVGTDVGPFLRLARSRERADLAEAGELFRGELLADFPAVARDFDDWLEGARKETTARAIEAQERLCDNCLLAGDTRSAVRAAERMVALDTLREDSHRKLMEAYWRDGRRADALRQYGNCVEVLKRELDLRPSRTTEDLHATIMESTDQGKADLIMIRPASIDLHRSGPPRIAVLPFRSNDHDRIPEHLSDGLAEDIVSQLTRLHELQVISYGSTIGFRNQPLTLKDIGDRLDINYAVRGSISRSGMDIRIRSELVEVGRQVHLWTHVHDTTVGISFQEQDDIVNRVVQMIIPRVLQSELQRIRGQRIDNLSVYEQALVARDQLSRLGRSNFRQAKDILDKVIQAEPEWGEAYALAADWHGLMLGEGWSGDRHHHLAEIDRLSRKALALDPQNVRALTFYAHRRSLHHQDYDTARQLFAHALDVAPSSAITWLWSSYTQSYVGDAPEAIRRAERALALSPCDRSAHWYYSGLCIAHYTAGAYDVASEWGRKAMSEPQIWRAGPFWVAASMAAAGHLREARDALNQGLEKWPGRKVRDAVASSPYEDPARRAAYGTHLLAAGMTD